MTNIPIKAIKSVYSYYFPEVRKVVDDISKKYPHSLLLKSVFPGLDDFHQPLIQKYIQKSQKYQKGLGSFSYSYFSNGSSEAIFHLLVDALFIEKIPVYMLKGDYEGYREYTKNLGGNIIEVEDDPIIIKKLPLGRWFISNPSSRDGNLIDNSKIKYICDLGHQVILDLAYLGLTKEYQIDLTHPGIIAVVASLSKPYGLFYSRIGFTFSRKPLPTLYPNKWFKNILSICIGEKILDSFDFGYFYKKYKSWQETAIKQMSRENGVRALPSDVLLLSFLPKEKVSKNYQEKFQDFLRGDNYRFCLTPYFLDFESKG